VATALGGTNLALLGAELRVCMVSPRFPVQQVGARHPIDIQGEGEALQWPSREGENRQWDACPEGSAGPRVLVYGSSVRYGA